MDPITLALIGLAVGGAGTGMSLYGQHQARREAKAQNAEQRRMDAYTALMQAAMGAVPSGPRPLQALPQVDYGGAVAGLGQGLMSLSGAMNQQKQQTFENDMATKKLAIDQSNADAMKLMRQSQMDSDVANYILASDKAANDKAWQDFQMRHATSELDALKDYQKGMIGARNEATAAAELRAILAAQGKQGQGQTMKPLPAGTAWEILKMAQGKPLTADQQLLNSFLKEKKMAQIQGLPGADVSPELLFRAEDSLGLPARMEAGALPGTPTYRVPYSYYSGKMNTDDPLGLMR